MAVENGLWTPPPLQTVRLYRCLRSERRVSGGKLHDECQDIINRNPHIKFEPGLQGVEVDHLIHDDTLWDADGDNFPRKYLRDFKGSVGHILASIEYTEGVDRAYNALRFYQPDYFQHGREKSWWIAGRTAIAKVRIEEVVERS